VARAIDVDHATLSRVLRRAAEHKGTAFVEIYQHCNVFNDGAFEMITEKAVRSDRLLVLEHGKPLVFGKERQRGIRMRPDSMLEVVDVGDDTSGVLVHDETRGGGYPFELSALAYPDFPEPMGVLRAVRRPTYEEIVVEQGRAAVARRGHGDLKKLLSAGETWVVS